MHQYYAQDVARHVLRDVAEAQVADALLTIRGEDPELLRTSPHTHVVSRPDEVKAAKEPVLHWTPADGHEAPLPTNRAATTGNPAGAP